MKLFNGFEAIKFYEENMIFVTCNRYLYYIYNINSGRWMKYQNAGNDLISVERYEEISRDELSNAMHGVFPKKETDFMRLCHPSQLCVRDMLDILKEDYMKYMSDSSINYLVHNLLRESVTRHKTFEKIVKLLSDADATCTNKENVLEQISALNQDILGRDVLGEQIEIVDGHDSSSYFWIMPVRVIDYSDTENSDNVAEMRSIEISIEEDIVAQYLTPYLYKHFDAELEANKKRAYASDFEWNLTYNFFTFDSVKAIVKDINKTIEELSSESENEPLISFYRRFIYRMEYMMTVGKENGYDLISFMGP